MPSFTVAFGGSWADRAVTLMKTIAEAGRMSAGEKRERITIRKLLDGFAVRFESCVLVYWKWRKTQVRRLKTELHPAITRLRQRQRTHALARGREDRVGDGRQDRRQRRFAKAGRVVVGDLPVRLDL